MSIALSSNFNLVTALPLDARYVAIDLTDRDAIASIQRFDGLMVYVLSDQTVYMLRGGITNADWAAIGTGAPGTNGSNILSGPADPVDLTDGVNGDFWINTTTFDFFGPKTAGAWGAAIFNMQGPQGVAGPSVEVDWKGVPITAAASKINFIGLGVKSIIETSPGIIDVNIQGGGGGEDVPPEIFGACDAPLDIPATGLRVASDHMSQEAMNQVVFVQGLSGAVDVTANPQIDPHDFIGAMLTIIGKSDTNTLTLHTGNGLKLNGTAVLGLSCVIRFIWNGSLWIERRRNF